MRTIVYLRKGRQRRGSGYVIDQNGEFLKVQPYHPEWLAIWVTPQEVAAAKERPPMQEKRKPKVKPATDKNDSPQRPKHHPKLIEAWHALHSEIHKDLIPEPPSVFVLGWNLGWEQAKTEFSIPTSKTTAP